MGIRTTVEIPDELYRTLKARAALQGVPVREVVVALIEQGMKSTPSAPHLRDRRRQAPPIAISPHGLPIQALTREEMRRAEEREDEAKLARSS